MEVFGAGVTVESPSDEEMGVFARELLLGLDAVDEAEADVTVAEAVEVAAAVVGVPVGVAGPFPAVALLVNLAFHWVKGSHQFFSTWPIESFPSCFL